MNFPKQLYTPASLLTLGGSAVAVYLFTNLVAGQIFGWNKAALGFLFAEFVAFSGLAALSSEDFKPKRKIIVLILVAFCNGMLIYSQSVGLNSVNNGFPTSKTNKAAFIPLVDPAPWWPPADQQIAIRQAIADLTAAEAPLTDLAGQFKSPGAIAQERREAAERTLAESRQRHARLERDLTKAQDAERRAAERQPRPEELRIGEQQVEGKQAECARLEREIGKEAEVMRGAALQAYQQCSRELADERTQLTAMRQAVEALKEATRDRQTLESALSEAVRAEQTATETLGKLLRLERAVAEARRADQEAGNVVLLSLTGKAEQSKRQLQVAVTQLERAYLPPALSARRPDSLKPNGTGAR